MRSGIPRLDDFLNDITADDTTKADNEERSHKTLQSMSREASIVPKATQHTSDKGEQTRKNLLSKRRTYATEKSRKAARAQTHIQRCRKSHCHRKSSAHGMSMGH